MKLHKNITLLTWFNFFSDFRLYAPIAIIYFSQVAGSYALGLSIFSIEMLATSLFEVPTGVFSDRAGRKNTIVLGSIASVVSLIFYAIGLNFYILAIGSLFAGIARSFFSGNNSALLHETLQESGQAEEYAQYSGSTNSMFQLALAISALLGSIIAFWSFPAVMWISVVAQVICLILSLHMVEPKVHDKTVDTNIYAHLQEALKKFKENKKLRLLTLASVISNGIGETLYQFTSVFIGLVWPIWAIGISKMLSNIFAFIGTRVSGRITKKIGALKTLIYSQIYGRVIGIVAVLVPSIISPILLASTSAPFGVGWIAQDVLFQKEFTNKQRATMGSISSLFGNLFFAVFAFLFGYVADMLSPQQALILGEFLFVGVLFIYWRLFKHPASNG